MWPAQTIRIHLEATWRNQSREVNGILLHEGMCRYLWLKSESSLDADCRNEARNPQNRHPRARPQGTSNTVVQSLRLQDLSSNETLHTAGENHRPLGCDLRAPRVGNANTQMCAPIPWCNLPASLELI